MKRNVALVLIVVMSLMVVFAGCGSTGPAADTKAAETTAESQASADSNAQETEAAAKDYSYVVGFVNLTDSDENCYLAAKTFADIVKSDDFKKKIGSDKNVEVVALDSNMKIEIQQSHVENLIAQKVDQVFLIGADTEGNSVSVEECNKAGIPIYMVATEATRGNYKFIGWVEEDYGRFQGEWAAKNLKQNANICYLEGTPGREAFIKREAGFMEVIKAKRPDVKVLSTQACPNTTAEQALQVTEDWIQAYGNKIDAVVSQANLMSVGVVQALKAAKMLDKVTVVSGIHSSSWDVQQIKDGEVQYAVYVGFDALGELAADICARTYLGQEVKDKEMLQLEDVTKDNVMQKWPNDTTKK